MNKFLHGLAIGGGIVIAFTFAIMVGASVLYLVLYTEHLDSMISFIDRI